MCFSQMVYTFILFLDVTTSFLNRLCVYRALVFSVASTFITGSTKRNVLQLEALVVSELYPVFDWSSLESFSERHKLFFRFQQTSIP